MYWVAKKTVCESQVGYIDASHCTRTTSGRLAVILQYSTMNRVTPVLSTASSGWTLRAIDACTTICWIRLCNLGSIARFGCLGTALIKGKPSGQFCPLLCSILCRGFHSFLIRFLVGQNVHRKSKPNAAHGSRPTVRLSDWTLDAESGPLHFVFMDQILPFIFSL